MNEIHQNIKAGAKSICPYCAHYPVCRAVDNQPCEECNQYAPPVRRGRWQYNTDFYVWRCSECGENPHKGTGVVVAEENLPAYCPHCGAIMDGAE